MWRVGQVEYCPPCWGVEWTLTKAIAPEGGPFSQACCGSVGWGCPADLKGHRLDSRSGHLPGLPARSRRRHVRGSQCMLLPLPCSLKIFKKVVSFRSPVPFGPFFFFIQFATWIHG